MKFVIHQKLLQTDYYEIEAPNAKAAAEIYEKTKGTLHSSGSTSGWPFDDQDDFVVTQIGDDQ